MLTESADSLVNLQIACSLRLFGGQDGRGDEPRLLFTSNLISNSFFEELGRQDAIRMKSIARLPVIVSFVVGILGGVVYPSGADEPADRIVRLEAELRAAKDENARLRKVLADHGIEIGRGYQSIVEILDELPTEWKSPKAWDKFTIESVVKFLNERPVGESFEATMQIAKVEIKRNPIGSATGGKGWMVSIHPESKDFKFRGLTLTQTVGENWPQPLRLYGDEQFARSAERLKVGQRITVMGKIRSIHLGREEKSRRDVHIGLGDLDVKLPGS